MQIVMYHRIDEGLKGKQVLNDNRSIKVKNEVRVFLSRKILLKLVLLFFAVHTDEVTYTVITFHHTFKVDVIRVSLALPYYGRPQRLQATRIIMKAYKLA